jgi:hypothetical protein
METRDPPQTGQQRDDSPPSQTPPSDGEPPFVPVGLNDASSKEEWWEMMDRLF